MIDNYYSYIILFIYLHYFFIGKESKGQTPNFLNNNKYNIVESEIELKNFSSEIELEKVV